MEKEDLKKCDVYSIGILVNELITEKKPYEGITEENCYKRKVTDNEKPVIPPPYTEDNPLCILMRACWNDPSVRVPFSEILDTNNGYLTRIKKNITSIYNYAEILREKLKNLYKGVEDIDFPTYWKKFESVYGKEVLEKSAPFIKVLFKQSSENQIKVQKKDAMRICDWLSGADNKWISEGFRESFFFQNYMGEKSQEQIKNDATLQDISKCLGVLHWDFIKNAFIVSVKPKGTTNWTNHYLNTKTICYNNLQKEVNEFTNTKFKDQNIQWMHSQMFEHLNTGSASHVYTELSFSDSKLKIASVYVY